MIKIVFIHITYVIISADWTPSISTVCPRSSDPFYIVTFFGHTVHIFSVGTGDVQKQRPGPLRNGIAVCH